MVTWEHMNSQIKVMVGIHTLISCAYIPKRSITKALKAEWKEITGDSHVLNVTAAKHPKEPELDFLEVFKYAVKFSDLSPQNNIHAWEISTG